MTMNNGTRVRRCAECRRLGVLDLSGLDAADLRVLQVMADRMKRGPVLSREQRAVVNLEQWMPPSEMSRILGDEPR